MKTPQTLAVLIMVLLVTSFTFGQSVGATDQGARPGGFQLRGSREFGSTVAFGSFSLGDEERFGPVITIQYTPNRHTFPAMEFFVGALIQTGTSGEVDTRNLVPVQSYFAPYYSPFSDYRNENAYRSPNFSIGLAFLGSDVTFFLLDGQVRPYVSFGGSLAFWSSSNRFSGTIAPDAKAGLDVRVNTSFSGFVEVRRMFSVPNLFGWRTPNFDGITSAAIGVSFAPRLR
jgi:hypothetical protein